MDEGVDNQASLRCGCIPFYRRRRQQSNKSSCARGVVIGDAQTPVTPGLASELLTSGGVELSDTGRNAGPATPQHETPTEPRIRKLQIAQPKTDLIKCVTSLEVTFGTSVLPLISLDSAPPNDGNINNCKYASARPSHAGNSQNRTIDQVPMQNTSSDTDGISTSPAYGPHPHPRPQPSVPPEAATARVIHLASYRRASSFGITARKPSLLGRPTLLPSADRPPSGALQRALSGTGSLALAQSNTGVVELSSAQLLPALHPDTFPPSSAGPNAPLPRRMSFGRINIGLPTPASGVGSAPNSLTVSATGLLGGPGQQQDIILSSLMTCDSVGTLSVGGAAACAGACGEGGGEGAAGGGAGNGGGCGGGQEGSGGAGGSSCGGGEGRTGGLLGVSVELPRCRSFQGGGLSCLLNGDTGAISTGVVEQLRHHVLCEQEQGGLAGQPIEVDNLEQVGQGSFGVVYRGVWQGAAVAIKYLVASSTQQLQISATEALLSKLLAHPNVVQTFACKVVRLTSIYFICPETSLAHDPQGSGYGSDDDGGGGCTIGRGGGGGVGLFAAAPTPAVADGAPLRCTPPCTACGGISGRGAPCTCKCGRTRDTNLQHRAQSGEAGSPNLMPPQDVFVKALSDGCPTLPSAGAPQQRQEDPQPSPSHRSSNYSGGGSGPGPPRPATPQPTAATGMLRVESSSLLPPPPPTTSATAANSCSDAPPEPADLTPASRAMVDVHMAPPPPPSFSLSSPSPSVHGGRCGCRCGGERPSGTPRPEEDDSQRSEAEVLLPTRDSPTGSAAVGGGRVLSVLDPGGESSASSPDAVVWADRIVNRNPQAAGPLALAGTVAVVAAAPLAAAGVPAAAAASPCQPPPNACAPATQNAEEASPQPPTLQDGLRSLLQMAAAETGCGLESFHSGDGFGVPYLGDECASRPSPLVLSKYQELLGQIRAQPGDFLTQIIMEYCDRGSLQRAIDKRLFRASSRWSARVALRAMLRTAREVAQGMCHLHASQIVHGDLKPANVLLKSSRSDRRGFVAKVADFGLSKILHLADHSSLECGTDATGTLAYMAPEVLAGSLSPSADVYSFGVILWQLATCERPFADVHPGHLFMGVCGGSLRLEWPSDTHPMVRKLGEACMAFEKRQRPSFTRVARTLGVIETIVRNEGAAQAAAAAAAATAPAALPPALLLREAFGAAGLIGGALAPYGAGQQHVGGAMAGLVLAPTSGSGQREGAGPAPPPRMLKQVLVPPSHAHLEAIHPGSTAMQIPQGAPPFIQMHMRAPRVARNTNPGYGCPTTAALGSGTGNTGAPQSASNANGCMSPYGCGPAAVATAAAAAAAAGGLFGSGHRSYPNYTPLVAAPRYGAEGDGVAAGYKGCFLAGNTGLLADVLTAPVMQVTSSSYQRATPDSVGGAGGGVGGGGNNTAGGGGWIRPQHGPWTGAGAVGGGMSNMSCGGDVGHMPASSIILPGLLVPDSMPRGVAAAPAVARTSAPVWPATDRPRSQPHTTFLQPPLPYYQPYPCHADMTACQPQHLDGYPCAMAGAAVVGIGPSPCASPSSSPQKEQHRVDQLPMWSNAIPSLTLFGQGLPTYGSPCGMSGSGGDGGGGGGRSDIGGGVGFVMGGGGGEYLPRVASHDASQPHHNQQQQQLLQLQFQSLQQQLVQLQSSSAQQQQNQQPQTQPLFQRRPLPPFPPPMQQEQQKIAPQGQHQPASEVGANAKAATSAPTAPTAIPSQPQAVDGTPAGIPGPPLPLPTSATGMMWMMPSHVPVYATAAVAPSEPTAAAVDGCQLPQHYYHLSPTPPAASTIPLCPLGATSKTSTSAPNASVPNVSLSSPEQVFVPGPLWRMSPQQPAAAYLRPYCNSALSYLHAPCLAAGPYTAPALGQQGKANSEEDGAAAAAAAATAVSKSPSPPPPTGPNPTASSSSPTPQLMAQAPYPAPHPHFGTIVPSYFLPCLPYVGPGPALPVATHVLGVAELASTAEAAAAAGSTATTTASISTVTHEGNIMWMPGMPLPAPVGAPSPGRDQVQGGTLPITISTGPATNPSPTPATAAANVQPPPLSAASSRAVTGSPPQPDGWLAPAAVNRSPGLNPHLWGTLSNATTTTPPPTTFTTTTTTTNIGTTAAAGGLRAAIPFLPHMQPIDLRPVYKKTSPNRCGYSSQASSSPPTGSTTAASLTGVAASAAESYGVYQMPYGMVVSGSPMPYRDRDGGGWAAPGLRRDAIMEGDEEGL